MVTYLKIYLYMHVLFALIMVMAEHIIFANQAEQGKIKKHEESMELLELGTRRIS